MTDLEQHARRIAESITAEKAASNIGEQRRLLARAEELAEIPRSEWTHVDKADYQKALIVKADMEEQLTEE